MSGRSMSGRSTSGRSRSGRSRSGRILPFIFEEVKLTTSDWMKLSGIAIIVIGLAFRLKTAPVVVVAALVTGLLSGMPLVSNTTHEGVIDLLGRAFADNRLVTLFIVTLPAVGLAEKYGLQERAAELIREIASAT